MTQTTNPAANRDHFLTLALANPINRELVDRLFDLQLPDGALAGGCLFQAVWNGLTNREPQHGIIDYDVSFCDLLDLSWEAEDRVIKRCAEAFADLGVDVQVRNQARVHLWYPQKFGLPYDALQSTNQGIDNYLNRNSAFAVRKLADGGYDVYAPFGYDDVFEMRITPNPRDHNLPEIYYAKAERWRQAWPEATVVPWPH